MKMVDFKVLTNKLRNLSPEHTEEMTRAIVERIKARNKEYEEQARMHNNFDYNKRYTI